MVLLTQHTSPAATSSAATAVSGGVKRNRTLQPSESQDSAVLGNVTPATPTDSGPEADPAEVDVARQALVRQVAGRRRVVDDLENLRALVELVEHADLRGEVRGE